MSNRLFIKRRTLPNGIRLIQFPRSQNMTSQLSVVVEYGSKLDPEKNAGLAHFLEHMLPGGSMERVKLCRSIEQNGGYVNFFTDYEYTIGITDVFPEKLSEASKILLKLFFNSGFEEKKFELERKIISNEIDESFDDPDTEIDDMLRKNLYKNHPIRHPILGYHKTISQLSIDEMEKTHRTQYVPQNTILILTGKFSNKDVESIIQDFGEVNKTQTKLKKYKYIEKGKPRKEWVRTKTGISQTYLSVGSRTVSGKHNDDPAMDIFSTLIGNGVSSRLFRELREKRGLAYKIESSNCDGSDFGFFSICCAIKPNKLKTTTDLILKEITKIKTKKISNDELLKCKNMLIGDLFRGIYDPLNLHAVLASMEILFGHKYALKKYVERIQLVSVDELIEVANKYLGESNLSQAVLTPEEMDKCAS